MASSEIFQARMARLLLGAGEGDVLAVDEFCSGLDSEASATVARGAAALVRARGARLLVLVLVLLLLLLLLHAALRRAQNPELTSKRRRGSMQ